MVAKGHDVPLDLVQMAGENREELTKQVMPAGRAGRDG